MGIKGQVKMRVLYKETASTRKKWKPPEDCGKRKNMNQLTF
jgi:hypothetical protein